MGPHRARRPRGRGGGLFPFEATLTDGHLGQVREKYRVPLEEGERVAEAVRQDLAPLSDAMALVGSIRRRRPFVADVEFVVLPRDLDEFDLAMERLGFEAGGKRRKYTAVLQGVKVELYVAHKPEELGALTLAYTGDYLMNVAMRSKAKRMGYKMDQYGIWKGKKPVLQSPDEREFFDFLGMDWHFPEQRSLAARSELHKIARRLSADGLKTPEAAFVRNAMAVLKEEKYLHPDTERELRAIHQARFGTAAERATRSTLGAEELVELGIALPDGLRDGQGPEIGPEELQELWQGLYEKATGRDGTVRSIIVRVYPEIEQYWVEVEEGGAPAYYVAYTGPVPEGPETDLEALRWFAAAEFQEEPYWLGPFPSLPEGF